MFRTALQPAEGSLPDCFRRTSSAKLNAAQLHRWSFHGHILLVSGVFFAIFKTRRPHKLEENLSGHIWLVSGVFFAILKQEDLTSWKKTC
jgi:hypothetical protein